MHGQYFASRKFKVHGRSNPAVLFGNPIVNFTNPLDMEFLFIKGEVGINFLRYVCCNISRLFIYLRINGMKILLVHKKEKKEKDTSVDANKIIMQ